MDSGGVRRDGDHLCRATSSEAAEPAANCACAAAGASSEAVDTFEARARDFSSRGCQDVRVLPGSEHDPGDAVACSTRRPIAKPSRVQPAGSGIQRRQAESPRERHVDVFGNQHPPVATDLIDCFQCGRPVAAGRFAPHLHKCLGKGRMASRQASKAWMNMAPKSHGKDKPSSKASTAQAAAAPAPGQPAAQPRTDSLVRDGGSALPKPSPAESKGEEGKRSRQSFQQRSGRVGSSTKGGGQGRDATGRSLRASSRNSSPSSDCPASRTRSRIVQGADPSPNREEARDPPAQSPVHLQHAGGGGTDPGCIVEASPALSPRALLRAGVRNGKGLSNFRGGSVEIGEPTEAYFLEAADLKTIPGLESASAALPGLTPASSKQLLEPKLECGGARAGSPVPSDGTSTTTVETCRESLSPCSVHEEHHVQGLPDEHGNGLDVYDPILDSLSGACVCLPPSIPTRKRRGRIGAIDTTYVRQLKLRDH